MAEAPPPSPAVYAGHRDAALEPRPSAVAIGVFDGVHRGHRLLLEAALTRARASGLRALVMTFDPHPAHLVRAQRGPALLEPVAWRVGRLQALGFEAVVVEPFDARLAAMTPAAFVAEVLHSRLGARHLVVGEDFRFGRGRSGGLADLTAAPGAPTLTAHPLAPVMADGQPISSSRLRAAVAAGDVGQAAILLGRPFCLVGEVVAGARRGRTLGFPTANLAAINEAAVGRGVYAAWAAVEGAWARAVVNVGTSPTFVADGATRVEAHLLDFAGPSLYGRRLALALARRLRAEQRFAGAEALVAQIQADLAAARAALGGPPPDREVLAGGDRVGLATGPGGPGSPDHGV